MIRIDFHTHTHFSYDCVMEPSRILKKASERGITHIVINDHDTIKGGLACKSIEAQFPVKVIVGSEIKTDIGDVTGIFLKEEIARGNYLDVIRNIKNQGGLAILNHPYVGHNLSDVNFEAFDFIEGYNGRCNNQQNESAIALAVRHKKPWITGSDAHTYAEVGQNYSVFKSLEELAHPLQHHYEPAHAGYKVYSQLIKGFKKRDPLLVLKVVVGAPRKILMNK